MAAAPRPEVGIGRRRGSAVTSTSSGPGSCSRRRPTSRSGSRRSSRSSTRRRSSSRTASRTSTRPACEDDLLAESAAGELIATEIEIRSGGRDASPRRWSCQRERRARLFALADEHGAGARRDGHASVGELPRPADHRHAALRPAARGARAGWRSATTPGACTSTSACAAPTARSPSATTCAAVLPALLAVSANSPFLDGRDTGLHSVRTEIFTRTFPRCGIHEPFGELGRVRGLRGPAGADQLDRRGDPALVERAAPPHASAPSSCGSATRRRAGRSRSRSRR